MNNEQATADAPEVIQRFTQALADALGCDPSECDPKLVLSLIEDNKAFEEGMRELASNLGAGGYNADRLSAEQLLEKVKWGVDHNASAQDARIQALTQQRDALKAKANGFDMLKAVIGSPEYVFVNMKAGAIAKPSLVNMVDLYGEVVNGAEAQLLEIARLRGQLQALEHAANEVLKWSDFVPALDEQPAGYVLVGVRRHALNTLHLAVSHRDLLKAVRAPLNLPQNSVI